MASLSKYIKSQRDRHLQELIELLRLPSISTEPAHKGDVKRAADWVRRRLKAAGCRKTGIHKTPGHPIVYGEWLGAKNAPTILVYGHYDVQPVDPVEQWATPPFEPTIKNKRIYARGASDDKGQFIVHLNALEAHLQHSNSCPVNVKFLLEGEEEIGSPNLEPFIKSHRAELACDAVVISDTAMFARGQPSICYGLRGLAYLQLTVRGTRRDLHSGVFGGAVSNPANVLTQMLAALKDARGRVAVPGFYDNVKRLTVAERRAFSALDHSDREFKASIGAPELYGENGYSTLERVWARPSLDINGIWGGFSGAGAKTVIPAEASAKVSMRLVPDQSPREIAHKVGGYLERIAPKSVKLTIEYLHGGEPWVTDTEQPVLQAAGRALRRAFNKDALFTREGGSIPVVATFDKLLRVPAILLGFGLQDDNLHAPNEKFELSNFYRGIESAAYLMEEIGESPPRR